MEQAAVPKTGRVRFNRDGHGSCIFAKDDMISLCYVDDMILFTRYERSIVDVLHNMNSKCRVEDVYKPNHFLALDLDWDSDSSILLVQTQLIDLLLLDTGMD